MIFRFIGGEFEFPYIANFVFVQPVFSFCGTWRCTSMIICSS